MSAWPVEGLHQGGLKVLGRDSSSNVQKVMWLLAELGQTCERVDIGGSFGGNREPDYLALNPNGAVPTLVDGEVVVWESNTILRYLCNRLGPTALYPAGAAARADVERWMDWQLAVLGPVNSPLFMALVRTPAAQQDAAQIEQLRRRNEATFQLLEQQLATRAFVAGPDLTLADIALGALVYRWFGMTLLRAPMPALEAWYGRLCERPAYRTHVMVGLR